MSRDTLERQIHHIQDEIILLGSMVEQAMLAAVDALIHRNLISARRIYHDDQLVNEKRYAIENAIIILIATQQPMAHDLRTLCAMLEVNTELERMGDYAKGIARITLRLGDADVSMLPVAEFERMANLATSMLHRALDAFVVENPNQAAAIPAEDDEVDALYNRIHQTLIQAMIADPALIDHTTLLLWVAHNLERMADRVTNICERTVFIATGEMLEIDSTDDEIESD